MANQKVVQLKSGGPVMTVSERKAGKCLCTWFDNKKELQTAWFNEDDLEAASKPAASFDILS